MNPVAPVTNTRVAELLFRLSGTASAGCLAVNGASKTL